MVVRMRFDRVVRCAWGYWCLYRCHSKSLSAEMLTCLVLGAVIGVNRLR